MFRIAQVSDTHLSGTKPFFVENFRRIGQAIAASDPDLLLNSGDISLDGASHEEDLAAARALHDTIGLPMRFLPGNHDLGDAQDAPHSVTGHGEAAIDAARRERYMKHFGPDWWTVDVPGWRLLGLNAQLLGSDLAAARQQDYAIELATSRLGRNRLALFLHKPLFDKVASEDAITGRFINPAPRRHLIDLLGEAHPALVVSGHVHQYRETWPGGDTRHVWGVSTAFVLPDRVQPLYGVKQTGYVEHRLYEDGTHESELVRVPEVPTLDIADFPEAYGPV